MARTVARIELMLVGLAGCRVVKVFGRLDLVFGGWLRRRAGSPWLDDS